MRIYQLSRTGEGVTKTLIVAADSKVACFGHWPAPEEVPGLDFEDLGEADSKITPSGILLRSGDWDDGGRQPTCKFFSEVGTHGWAMADGTIKKFRGNLAIPTSFQFNQWMPLDDLQSVLAMGGFFVELKMRHVVKRVQFHHWSDTHAITCLIEDFDGETYDGTARPQFSHGYVEELGVQRSFHLAVGKALRAEAGRFTSKLTELPFY